MPGDEAGDEAGEEIGWAAQPISSSTPAVMRIPSLIKQLLEEVRAAPLDEAGRTRLTEICRCSISELEQGLAPELIEELERITSAIRRRAPNDAELRIAQAQLLGWLEGLLHGVQPSCFSLEMATQQQLQTMRRMLPPDQPGQDGPAGQPTALARGAAQTQATADRRGSTSNAGRRHLSNQLWAGNCTRVSPYDPIHCSFVCPWP